MLRWIYTRPVVTSRAFCMEAKPASRYSNQEKAAWARPLAHIWRTGEMRGQHVWTPTTGFIAGLDATAEASKACGCSAPCRPRTAETLQEAPELARRAPIVVIDDAAHRRLGALALLAAERADPSATSPTTY